MKAVVHALNKKYLVEFESDTHMISFLTEHNNKIEHFEMLNENTIPALEKAVEIPTVSKPTGWKTMEKSSFTTKETSVEKKGMTLGGKYGEFKYEPNKNLESSTTDKVSDTSTESPALKGNEPKVSSVEDTKEVKSDKQPKASHKDVEDDSEEDTKTEEKKEVSESVKDFLPRGGFIKDDETEHKEGIWGGQGTDEQIRKAKLIAKVKHANGDRMGRVTKEDLDNYESYLEQYQEIFGLNESKKSDETEHKHEEDEFEKTHECSWCGEKFPESEMKCEKDMGWLCEHDWRYLETQGDEELEEVDPSEIGLDETDANEDYQNGFEEGKFAYESGHFISPDDRNDMEGDSETEDFWRGYDDGYESAKEGLDDSEEEIEEGFKDGLKKAGNFAKNAVAGAAVAGSLMTANPATAQISPDGTNSTDGYLQAQVEDDGQQQLSYAEIVKAGKPITLNGHTYTVQELEQMKQEQGFDEADMDDIVNGIDPYYDGATRP